MPELFISIRCEELPARFVARTQAALQKAVLGLLKGIPHGACQTWGAPRRVAISVQDVALGKEKKVSLVTGPPESSAFRDGAPTRAAMGFARGRGIDVSELEIVDGPKGRVVAARVSTGGEQTADLVAAGLAGAIAAMPFPKSMRWGSGPTKWGRPIHGIVALLDGQRIDCELAGVRSGTTTVGHRLFSTPITVQGSQSWLAGLRAHKVEPDAHQRRAAILAQLDQAAQALGADVGPFLALVDEVQNLAEWPVVVPAQFDARLLDLPPRLLVEAMKVHQRVFPLMVDGALSHHFLVVTNQPLAADDPEARELIGVGNARVLAARFHDAKFFFAEDKRQDLAAHAAMLQTMRWIRNGGTMADKQARVSTTAAKLAGWFGADAPTAGRAGALCKADLATQMVGEFPELQGHVGKLLALHQGEPAPVALAIEEHYLPRSAADALPTSPAGRAVALADRLDTLGGCFAAGLKPKGSADPLGLRRAANGLLLLVQDAGLHQALPEILGAGPHPVPPELVDFVMARLKAQLSDSFGRGVVNGVLATGDTAPVALHARCAAVHALSQTADWAALHETFKRVMGLTRDHSSAAYRSDQLQIAEERALHAAFAQVQEGARAAAVQQDFAQALSLLTGLKPAVDAFFAAVFVMDDDPQVRANRLGLLRSIADEFRHIADFSQLSVD